MPIDFPNNPTSGQTYSYDGKLWAYNGFAWDLSSDTINSILAGPGITVVSASGNYTVSALATVKGSTGTIQLAYGSDLVVDTGFILDPNTAQLEIPNGLKLSSGLGLDYIEFSDGTTQGTAAIGGGSNNFTEGSTAPTPVYAGDRWFDIDDGNLYTAITDDSGLVWVQLNAGIIGPTGATGVTGATGPVGDYVISVDGATGAVNLKPFIIAMATAL